MPLLLDKENIFGSNVIESVAINTTLKCNLSCVGCNSFSDMKIDDGFDPAQRIEWIRNLADFATRMNLSINGIDILGGEPFLDDNHIEIARIARNLFPKSIIAVFTNGLLLANKQQHIQKYLELNIELAITMHDIPDNMKTKVLKGVNIWKSQGVYCRISSYDPGYARNKDRLWRQAVIYKEDKVYPHSHGDHRKAWFKCSLKDCLTLQDNKLYYCPIMALLPSLLNRTGQLDDKQWQPYLNYQPLDLLTAGLDDTIDFFQSTPGHRCAMCPINDTRPAFVPALETQHHMFDKQTWLPKI